MRYRADMKPAQRTGQPKYTVKKRVSRNGFEIAFQHRSPTPQEASLIKAEGWGVFLYSNIDFPAVGFIVVQKQVYNGKPVMVVSGVETNKNYRRMGIATKLYAQASKLACSKFGIPLASDVRRSDAADAFWQKQKRAKQAKKVRIHSDDAFVTSCARKK